jgi:DNA polymerase III gamma/tau subunit
MEVHAKSFSTTDVLRMMKAFNSAATDLRGGWQPSLGLELALAEVMEAREQPTPQITAPVHTRRQATTLYQEAPKPVQSEATSSSKGEADAPKSEKPIISAGEVIKAWKQIAASLPKSQANLSALLNSVKMIDVRGDMLILGFASDVLVGKMNKPEQLEAAQKAITEALGVKLNIRCVVTNTKGKVPPHVSQDGMVAAAIQHGGEIVDMD